MTDQMTDARAEFENWATTVLSANRNWRESGQCELAWQSWQQARLRTLSEPDDEMLPEVLAPHSKEWYQLCERSKYVTRLTISGELAEAIVAAVCRRRPALSEQQYSSGYRDGWEAAAEEFKNGVQTPVAWRGFSSDGVEFEENKEHCEASPEYWQPLYTHPELSEQQGERNVES